MAVPRPTRVVAFAAYEVRRALARKKVIAIAAFTVVLVTAPYFILSTLGPSDVPASLFPFVWVVGAIAPFNLFIQLIGILIAAGAMSEEYEAGTAELLLSKPVSRTEFFVGKYLGGYFLLAVMIALDVGLSVVSATLTYGPQTGLETVPGLVVVEILASALFYSVAFTLGELVRRSSLAYILASAVVVSSQFIGTFLVLAYEITGKALYQTIHVYLPTTVAGSIPSQFEQPLLPSAAGRVFSLILGPSAGVPSQATAAAIVAAYFFIAMVISLGYFRWADVSRRVN